MNRRWQGKLNLTYSFNQGITSVNNVFCQAPLKIQRPFYPEGKDICHSTIIHTAGGIVGGDILMQNINLEPNSQVFITTPTATKIYKSEEQLAEYHTTITLENNTYLEYFPLENIIFNKANYLQTLTVNLGENTGFLTWEINRFGRTARQEKFISGRWRSHTEIYQNCEPILIDRQQQIGDETLIKTSNSLNQKPLVATLIYLGKPITKKIINETREKASKYLNSSFAEIGITTTLTEGLICRYRGFSTSEVKNIFQEIWQILRHFHQQRQPIKPRFWT